LEKFIEAYLEYRKTLNLSRETLKGDRTSLRRFQTYLTDHRLPLAAVTRQIIREYWESLVLLSGSTVRHYLVDLKQFYRYCRNHDLILCDPFYNLELPRVVPNLACQIPTPREVRQILESIDISTRTGLRDRAILELVYSSGLRAGETARLNLEDLDLADRLLRVHGKGNKERIVPFGRSAARYLKRYLKTRPHVPNPALFLNRFDKRVNLDILEERLHRHAQRVGLWFKFHSLRHACALHMLQNNAGIRYIQELLGHSELRSTQIYTQLLPLDLKKSHHRYHPREKEATKRKQGIPASSLQSPASRAEVCRRG
jgi:integrase/recombinase XerD